MVLLGVMGVVVMLMVSGLLLAGAVLAPTVPARPRILAYSPRPVHSCGVNRPVWPAGTRP